MRSISAVWLLLLFGILYYNSLFFSDAGFVVLVIISREIECRIQGLSILCAWSVHGTIPRIQTPSFHFIWSLEAPSRENLWIPTNHFPCVLDSDVQVHVCNRALSKASCMVWVSPERFSEALNAERFKKLPVRQLCFVGYVPIS
jgi:hypothetical protein